MKNILLILLTAQLVHAQPRIDLTGTWKLNTDEIVVITQHGSQVTAVFSPPVQCHGDMRTTLFTSPFDSNALTLGSEQFYACTREQKLIDDLGLTPIYQTKFQ